MLLWVNPFYSNELTANTNQQFSLRLWQFEQCSIHSSLGCFIVSIRNYLPCHWIYNILYCSFISCFVKPLWGNTALQKGKSRKMSPKMQTELKVFLSGNSFERNRSSGFIKAAGGSLCKKKTEAEIWELMCVCKASSQHSRQIDTWIYSCLE